MGRTEYKERGAVQSEGGRSRFVHSWLNTSRSITLRSSCKFNGHASRTDSSHPSFGSSWFPVGSKLGNWNMASFPPLRCSRSPSQNRLRSLPILHPKIAMFFSGFYQTFSCNISPHFFFSINFFCFVSFPHSRQFFPSPSQETVLNSGGKSRNKVEDFGILSWSNVKYLQSSVDRIDWKWHCPLFGPSKASGESARSDNWKIPRIHFSLTCHPSRCTNVCCRWNEHSY